MYLFQRSNEYLWSTFFKLLIPFQKILIENEKDSKIFLYTL